MGLHIPELSIAPLMAAPGSGTPELYGEMGGLFQTQKFMGLASDMKNVLTEDFSWLETPENLTALFDIGRQTEALLETRRNAGWGAWWEAWRFGW